MITALFVASRAANRPLLGMALVFATEVVAAVFLRQFLLAEDWRVVVMLLAVFAVALVAFERRPNLEGAIASAFRTHRRFAVLVGVALVALFPV